MRLTDPPMKNLANSSLLRGRYQPLPPLSDLPAPLLLALDTANDSLCVLKPSASIPPEILAVRERVRSVSGTVTFNDVFTTTDSTFLVLAYLQGESLATYHQRLLLRSQSLAWDTLLEWAIRAAAILVDCHSAGVVHGALKPGHWYLDTGGDLHLLDFSHARQTTQTTHEQLVAAEIADFGTWLYTLATDYPYLPPANPPRWKRPRPSRLNPTLPPAFDTLIARCWRKGDFTDMNAVRRALIQLQQPATAAYPAQKRQSAAAEDVDGLKTVVLELGETLAKDILETRQNRTLYDGAAGMVRVLAYLAAAYDMPLWKEAALSAADRLANQPIAGAASLYHGEAGVAFALGCVAQDLDAPQYFKQALARAEWIAAQPISHHDLTRGAAGRLHLHLTLWQATGAHSMLNAARDAAAWLIAHRQIDEQRRTFWHTPTPRDPAPGAGYAHGTAGVADMLLSLWESTHEVQYLNPAATSAQWLEAHAISVSSDGTCLQWETSPNGPQVTYWCHGAAGIAPFFLNAERTALTPTSGTIARRALLTVARRGAPLAPSLCHGVAGALRTLLYAHSLAPTPQSLADCRRLGEVLLAYRYHENQRAVTPSGTLGAPHPGYMTGYSGVAFTLSLLYQTLTASAREVPYVA